MQKLKDLARRGIILAATAGLILGVDASMLPTSVLADALNPLTERTLLLSSSAPGYVAVDGSGNPTYAPPDSGPNGMKTGETFSFKTSTDSLQSDPTHGPVVKAMTFQFCTVAAGTCSSPGDDLSDPGGTDDSTHADLDTNYPSPAEVSCSGANSYTNVAASTTGIVNPDNSQGNFVVLVGGTCSTGWVMNDATANTSLVTTLEDPSPVTGKDNFITLTNTTGIQPTAGDPIKVIFYGTNLDYITNPGEGAFFVKINDFDNTAIQDFRDNYPYPNECNPGGGYTDGTGTTACSQNVIDGGVTVANVMNNSIQIHTKVLETLDFSVGTTDPDTMAITHGPCDAVNDDANNNGTGNSGGVINLGNPSGENSLSTARGYDNFSYWRLSSNSSNGATVYYSGETLSDTEADQVAPTYYLTSGHTPGDNSAEYTHPGSEQFGLGIDVTYQSALDSQGDNGYIDDYAPSASKDGSGSNNTNLTAVDSGFTSDVSSGNPTGNYFNSWHQPQLFPLVPMGASVGNEDGGTDGHGTLGYGLANGSIGTTGAGARFAFSSSANTIPVPIASESTTVVNCATGLMRYIGNIAATTPAGIYTTAVNYLAAPEY